MAEHTTAKLKRQASGERGRDCFARTPGRRVDFWPLQDIAIANIVLCMAYTGEVGEASNITQNVCNSIAIACERCRWAGQYQDD